MRKIVSNRGFTLVEILVSLGILVVLISLIIFAIDPYYQYLKAFDAQKKQDLVQIRNALDVYYNDHNCYPGVESSLDNPANPAFIPPFGQEWVENETVYMKKVPQDPHPYQRTGQSGSFYYNYKAAVKSDNLCSQWNVLYAKLADRAYNNKTTNEKSCMGAIRKRCGASFPVSTIYNYCVISGTLDCDELRAAGTPDSYTQKLEEPTSPPTQPPGGGGAATPTPTPTTAPTPTPTTAPIFCGGGIIPQYDCRGVCNLVCNVPPDDYDICIAKGAKYCDIFCDGNCSQAP